ncbi:M48 family metallopeptidase [Chloroflexota bacterium]
MSYKKRGISFNWKLMLALEPVVDYVVVHEIAHLKEMNHTRRFWNIVAEHCPRWREHRKWLKEHEAALVV